MSNIQAAAKVADQIIHRIFDQRQFTSGEIDYLVKEFGHDRINLEQNFEQVLKLNQDACVIADTNLEDLCNSSERLASNYCDQVGSLHDRAENLINLEAKCREKETRLLADARAERAKRRQEQHDDIQKRLLDLRESLKAEEEEMERKYRLFEQSLRDKK